MRLRLAFSVAAHLQPEILLVDEVLAVGDYEFEKKCLETMESIRAEGRTILFVSHNSDMILRLCKTGLLIDRGRVISGGAIQQVMNEYLMRGTKVSARFAWSKEEAPGNEVVSLLSIAVLNERKGIVFREDPLCVEASYSIKKEGTIISLVLIFYNERGDILFTSNESTAPLLKGKRRKLGDYISSCVVPRNIFNEGLLYISVLIIDPASGRINDDLGYLVYLDKPLHVIVRSLNLGNELTIEESIWAKDGMVRPLLEWTIR